jgi:GH24 family phage-related lysozyme (muramidase)
MTPKAKRLTTAAAIASALAIPAEGLRQWAYYDPPGILTVCYGSTKDVVKGRKYSLEECKDRLDADMMEAIVAVDRCVPNAPPMVLAAFGDAVYNIGPKIACSTESSTAARLLKAGQWDAACKQLPRWDKARVAGQMISLPGLTKRRKAEEILCLSWSQSA